MEVLNGENLIQTIVSLTELPEPLAQKEMDEILQLSGHRSQDLTLEQLRAAMLAYLEEIQASMASEIEEVVNDAEKTKAPVFLG